MAPSLLSMTPIKAEKNMKYALPRAIEWLLEQGYEFKVFD